MVYCFWQIRRDMVYCFGPIQFEIFIRNPMHIFGNVMDTHFEISRKDTAENKN